MSRCVNSCLVGDRWRCRQIGANNAAPPQVSAVSAKYNTTRDRVLGILTKKDTQITFYDTPGLIKPKYVRGVELDGDCELL